MSAVLLAALVGCGGASDAGGSGDSLSVDQVIEFAEGVGKDGADSCPLPYDAKQLAEAAKIDGGFEPGKAGSAGSAADGYAATADGGKRTDPQSPWMGKPGALVTCSYHTGGENLQIRTAATSEGKVPYVLAPLIQFGGGMDVTELRSYTAKAANATTGEAVPSKGGNVVTVRLDAGGKGDVALILVAGEQGKTSLKRVQVLELAKSFAGQAG
ncbi:hypothetical protein [Streptomyces sp. NPDC127092]|uniref:hypothetical protein n=1 Tax=Streptomyces sp. NPDC127092 TaxID=3347135 RepID=UPI00364EAFAE